MSKKFKIGFVDYFLDNWHASNYPALIEKYGEGKFEVWGAYAKIDGFYREFFY